MCACYTVTYTQRPMNHLATIKAKGYQWLNVYKLLNFILLTIPTSELIILLASGEPDFMAPC